MIERLQTNFLASLGNLIKMMDSYKIYTFIYQAVFTILNEEQSTEKNTDQTGTITFCVTPLLLSKPLMF